MRLVAAISLMVSHAHTFTLGSTSLRKAAVARLSPLVVMKDDPFWADGRNPYQQGMDGERVWLNTNGERVVRKKKKKPNC